jgi:hypothetical protein
VSRVEDPEHAEDLVEDPLDPHLQPIVWAEHRCR